MQHIGKYLERQVFWVDYEHICSELPDKDWLCLAIANQQPDLDRFDRFVRTAIAKNIFEFKGHGKLGEKLHDLFDVYICMGATGESGFLSALRLAQY